MDRLRIPLGWPGLMAVLAVLVMPLLAACGSSDAEPEVPQQEIAALASEAVDALDEAVAASGEQLQEAAEVVSEAVAVGELGLATPGTVVVGTNADFLPFAGYDDAQQLVGFDVDLFDDVARRAGLVPRYIDMPFPNLTGALTAGEVDVVIAALTVTNERDEVIDFTRPYFAGSQALAVPPGSAIASVEDLGDSDTVAVLADTTGETYAVDNFSDALIAAYPDRATLFSAVQAGAVQAVFMDSDAVVGKVDEGALVVIQQVPTDERYAIGLPEGNAPLRAALNTALGDAFNDGTYRALYAKWFPTRDVEQAINLLG